jgi:rubrerythrin
MTQLWKMETIHWDRFDPSQVDTALLEVVKTAAVVESNAEDYVTYLDNIFRRDQEFVFDAVKWGLEEELHGDALGRWAEMADPGWSYEQAVKDFRAGYKLDLTTKVSVRGSLTGELIARQVVETGTSSFYTALHDASREPCLKQICHLIASDEFSHYQMFAEHCARYQKTHPISRWAKIKVAMTRFQEAEDDELGYAFFAANVLSKDRHAIYAARNYGRDYWERAMRLYKRSHIESAVRMILRAVEMPPNGRLFKLVSAFIWKQASRRAARLAKSV